MAIQTNKDVTEITYNGVNVPLYHKTQTKSTTITSNGTTTIAKDADYDGMTSVEITTNVPTPAPSLQTKSVSITENGSTSVSADSGYDGLEQVNITTNVPAPAPSLQDITITENGTYTHAGYDGYDEVVVNVSGGGGGDPVDENKQVLFIDYDGTPLHSYTYDEAMALTSLPSNPSHSGLTAQGWNWTLAELQSYLTSYPYGTVVVGQNYNTSDGKTRVHITLSDNQTVYFKPFLNGSMTIDWGDGSSTSNLTGTSTTAGTDLASHNYAAGSYVIAITLNSGMWQSGSFPFYGNGTNNSYIVYRSVKKIFFGNGFIGFPTNAFQTYAELETVSIPYNSSALSIGNNAFYNCTSLKCVVVPSGYSGCGQQSFSSATDLEYVSLPKNFTLTSTAKNIFSYSSALRKLYFPINNTIVPEILARQTIIDNITIPEGVTTIKTTAFYQGMRIKHLVIPSTVTSIESYAFYMGSIQTIKFKSSTPPTLAAANAISGYIGIITIYVPTGSLSAYTSAANYPASGSKAIYKEY